ncbi:MAG: hypothetical protein NT135_00880 [Candidatus Berkelbacteria bacterium]|nr:hypothetical protein [Candidatus Berkelbacteria bacterium]
MRSKAKSPSSPKGEGGIKGKMAMTQEEHDAFIKKKGMTEKEHECWHKEHDNDPKFWEEKAKQKIKK